MKINHSMGYYEIKKILENERITLNVDFEYQFFDFLSKVCTYEEEEHKIKPQLLIGSNLEDFFCQCPSHYELSVFTDDLEGKQFSRIIKALVPLCENNWYVYVNILENSVVYGIFRKFQSPVSVSFEDLFFANTEDGSKEMEQYGLICIRPYEMNSFIVKSLNTEDTVISFAFTEVKEQMEAKLQQMKEDLLLSVQSKNKLYIEKAVLRVLNFMQNKLHGAICVIVEGDYAYPNDYLHGIVLKPPLNLVECIVSTEEVKTYEDAEKYYALTNLLYSFMNIDGITVINVKGEVIGYNAFYRSSETPIEETGGARKRTFKGLVGEMRKENSNIVGVYYQSQDGSFDYVRRDCDE